MRVILYFLAIICGIIAFASLIQPIIAALIKGTSGLSLLITFGIVTHIAPVAIALTVIPLCIAVAFDLATRP